MNWVVPERDRAAAKSLAARLRTSTLVAQLLVNRGCAAPEAAEKFLDPRIAHLLDPMDLPGMETAVRTIDATLRGGGKIGLYGDYDVDGLSGTALLARFFRLLGREAETYIPHRTQEGYGLNPAGIDALSARGVTLLITIDTGTTALREVEHARAKGMEVIIVDHHLPGAELPKPTAMVNPLVPDSKYPFRGLASSGLALKLALALSRGMHRSQKHAPKFAETAVQAMALAALGTIADVCPLLEENRVIVRYGLDGLAASGHAGLRALLHVARVEGGRVTPWDVSFRLAPRINAAGRMDSAAVALDLLMCDDETQARDLAGRLDAANRKRQKLEETVCGEAKERAAKQTGAAIVVGDASWHAGVVGIVAARLVDEFGRPAAVAGFEGGIGRGSVRAPAGFHIKEALDACAEHLVSGGGHARAGGFVVEPSKFEAFSRRFEEAMAEQARRGAAADVVEVDDEVSLEDLPVSAVRELRRLEPFGTGNPAPLLAARGVRIVGKPKRMGRDRRHVSFFVKQGEASARAVGFGMADQWDRLLDAETVSMAFTPELNEFRGTAEVELKVKSLSFD